VIEGRNIVCVASNWADHPTSKHHVMRRLAEHNHVLWVNYHASRRPQLSRGDSRMILQRLRQAWRGTYDVGPRFHVLSPLLVPWPESPAARAFNGWALARQIRRALRQFPRQPLQLWLFTPDIPELVHGLPAERVVYYCVDDFAAFSGFNTTLIEELERRTVAASDVVLATSTELHARHRTRHGSVHFLPHGVDYDHFSAALRMPFDAVPSDLRAIRKPVFGYMGLITDYVDFDSLVVAARARTEWSFVLLGDSRCSLDALAGLPNVHVLGGRPYEQLPAYCRGFDVGLIPFRTNRLTRAANPIKLREYLAAGLPVVSPPLSAVRPYVSAVCTTADRTTFVAACEAALKLATTADRASRAQLVQGESWSQRVEWISELVMTRPPTEARPEACGTPAREPQLTAP
jgi:glycosyltransferase involved in cell wall biosynthesis